MEGVKKKEGMETKGERKENICTGSENGEGIQPWLNKTFSLSCSSLKKLYQVGVLTFSNEIIFELLLWQCSLPTRFHNSFIFLLHTTVITKKYYSEEQLSV